MLYLKVFLTVWFYKIFNLIFLKRLSCPRTMCNEHWRKLTWGTFLGNFLILLVQQFCGAVTNSCLLEYATVFPIKNKFLHLIGYFEFLFWFSFAILLSKMKSLFLNLNEILIHNLNVRGFWLTILKSTHLINIYSFWNCLSRNLLLIRDNNHDLVLIIAGKSPKNSQNSFTLFLNIIPWYRQIKFLQ